ncbi:hypothetical protein LEMLEM_LOCUS7502, partial [Lemmus lemmus]
GHLDEFDSTQFNTLICIVRAGPLKQKRTKFPIQVHLVPLENDNYEPIGVQETKHHHRCYRHINSALSITQTYQNVFLRICNKGLPFPHQKKTSSN